MIAAEYLKLLKRPVEPLTVPQFGEVYVRGLSAPEYDQYEHASVKGDKFIPDTPTLIRYGMVDADGNHVFSDADLPALADLPSEVARPLRAQILKLSGIGADLGKS